VNAMQAASFWPVFAAVALLIGAAVAAMAVGVMFRRPCLRGACGGPKAPGPDGEAPSCPGCPKRDRAETGRTPAQNSSSGRNSVSTGT